MNRATVAQRALLWLAPVLLGALLLALPGSSVLAQEQGQEAGQHRAGLVIVHGDGNVTQQCVAFAEESISGYELLRRSQRALSVEAGAIGATVCSIDGEGCNFPQQSCFCQCQGSPCVYWSYWRQSPTGWLYQNLGAGNTQVRDGDVEGWHWAEGTTRTAKEPPAVSFAELCPVEAGAPEAETIAETNAETPVVTVTQPATDEGNQVVAGPAPTGTVQPAAAQPAAAPAPTAGAGPGATAAGQEAFGMEPERLLWMVLIALVVMPFAAIAVLALLRRGKRN